MAKAKDKPQDKAPEKELAGGGRARLGEILIQAGQLNDEKLKLALSVQKRTNERLGEVLHRAGYVRADAIAKALALQYGLAYIDPTLLTPGSVDLDALAKLSIEACRSAGMLPVTVQEKPFLVVSDILATKASDEAFAAIGHREMAVSTKAAIITAIENMAFSSKDGDRLVDSAAKTIAGGEINELLAYLLGRAVLAAASDIHIEPQGSSSVIRYRVDGVLRSEISIPRHRHDNLVNVLFAKSGIDLSDFQRIHDGRFSFEFGARELDVRFSSSPTLEGASVVLRILDDTRSLVTLDELGYTDWNYRKINDLLRHPHGVILVVGPTGSGKTTTLYSVLNILNNGQNKILTVEDPVEIKVPSLQQVRVNAKAGVTFANAVRSFLRQDPDIILVGEIRDEETAREAFRAANTGHLVFSTLHANSAVEAIGRLMDLGLDSYVVSGALLGVLSQRLARTLCKTCRVAIERRRESRDGDSEIKKLLGTGINRPYDAGPGCPNCRNGYAGRTVVAEVLDVSDEMRKLIHERRPGIELQALARSEGFVTLKENAAALVSDGSTSLDEAERVVGPLGELLGFPSEAGP